MNENDRRPLTGSRPDSRDTKKKKPLGSDKGKLNAEIQRRIGQQLKTMYSDVVNEGVPDRFADLISRLDKNG